MGCHFTSYTFWFQPVTPWVAPMTMGSVGLTDECTIFRVAIICRHGSSECSCWNRLERPQMHPSIALVANLRLLSHRLQDLHRNLPCLLHNWLGP
jgi:hypothetical protein